MVDELSGQVPLFSSEENSIISLSNADVGVNPSLEEIKKELH